jgi:hypothetical protein
MVSTASCKPIFGNYLGLSTGYPTSQSALPILWYTSSHVPTLSWAAGDPAGVRQRWMQTQEFSECAAVFGTGRKAPGRRTS